MRENLCSRCNRNEMENSVSYKVRGAIFNVYNSLGPGLLESVYLTALEYELYSSGLLVKRQVFVPIEYKGEILEAGLRMDLLVNDWCSLRSSLLRHFQRCIT